MKILCIVVAAAVLAGCTSTSRRTHEALPLASARVHVFSAPLTNTWRAALNAANRPPLVVRRHDAATGYIGSESPARWESWGERLSVWVCATNGGTAVAVASEHVGPYLAFHFDWRQPTLAAIAAELGEPIPLEPPTSVKPARSPKGAQ